MKLKLTVFVAASLLLFACDKGGETAPKEQPVQPAGQAAAADGAEAAKAAPAAEGGAAAAAPSGALKPPSTAGPNTQVFITEFSDFQCPFCSRVNPTIAKIKETYGDKVGLSFMHNALPFHKDARLAAIATEAANQQGKFWEMHDKLFANQRALKRADLEKYAGELGLDMAKFKTALDDKKIGEFVDHNRAVSNALGATGTPAFFINGKVLKGAQPFERFKAVIDEEITAAADKKGDAWIRERTKVNNADLAGYLWENKKPAPVAQQKPKPRPVDRTVYKVDVDNKKDGIKGNINAQVTLAIFSEFQCPFCKRVKPAFDQIEKEYGDKVRVVFKHNPLPFHKDAFPASEASLCANDQGKFWEMHDKLFENQRALTRPDLDKYATELGLDAGKYKSCMDSHKHKAQIEGDQELAGKVTARGTPNTFVNGRKLTGAKPFAEFKTVIDEELEKADALIAKGTSPENVYAELIKNGKVFEPLESKVNTFDITKNGRKGGKANAKIQIVEFSDFQCPFCSRVTQPLYDVAKHYGDEAVVAFKHFPLNFHKEAMPAAIAAECANDQGKFWEYHDVLFQNQKQLASAKWYDFAKQVGLDEKKFKDCFDNQKTKDRVEADMAEARKAGVRGTPTLFINGRKFTSPSGYNLNAFTGVIDKYIKGKK